MGDQWWICMECENHFSGGIHGEDYFECERGGEPYTVCLECYENLFPEEVGDES